MDVSQNEIVKKLAEKLKANPNIKSPEWAAYVKTGVSKERPPVNSDWWYFRTASVLLRIYKKGPIGVNKLRTLYGDKKNRGVKPEKFFKASGNILRKVLQQLDKSGLTKQAQVGTFKGRIITKEGKMILEATAQEVKLAPKVEKKKKFLEEKPKQASAVAQAPKVEQSEKSQRRQAQAPKQAKGEQ